MYVYICIYIYNDIKIIYNDIHIYIYYIIQYTVYIYIYYDIYPRATLLKKKPRHLGAFVISPTTLLHDLFIGIRQLLVGMAKDGRTYL